MIDYKYFWCQFSFLSMFPKLLPFESQRFAPRPSDDLQPKPQTDKSSRIQDPYVHQQVNHDADALDYQTLLQRYDQLEILLREATETISKQKKEISVLRHLVNNANSPPSQHTSSVSSNPLEKEWPNRPLLRKLPSPDIVLKETVSSDGFQRDLSWRKSGSRGSSIRKSAESQETEWTPNQSISTGSSSHNHPRNTESYSGDNLKNDINHFIATETQKTTALKESQRLDEIHEVAISNSHKISRDDRLVAERTMWDQKYPFWSNFDDPNLPKYDNTIVDKVFKSQSKEFIVEEKRSVEENPTSEIVTDFPDEFDSNIARDSSPSPTKTMLLLEREELEEELLSQYRRVRKLEDMQKALERLHSKENK
jgi:hypothetical protein